MINIIKRRFLFLAISIFALLTSIVLLLAAGLNIGMDFSGGSRLTLNFEQAVTIDQLESELASIGYGTAVVQGTSSGDFIIRTEKLAADEKETLKTNLTAAFGQFTEKGFEDIPPETAIGTARVAVIGLVLAAIGIMAYITWAFRVMPKPFRYGICAVLALLHDVLIVLGIFAILGMITHIEVNLMFITGILAVIGYSVNNIVVIFDRIRENVKANPGASFEMIVNNSVTQTFSRSINTSLTTVITVLALILFIGTNIESFAWTLFIGIIVGTLDSLFIAPGLLVVWEKNEWHRFINWLPMFKAKQQ
ncbi:MAG: protein translocase subunit SecF [Dehalococcoidales bacterium]|jgi:preprotein translocase subunit SecF|nr:protein translocase subunit SecF [Dehalococcoidales bacterium]